MIKAVAPCRISLFGGGSDVATYYQQHGGLVINMAVNIRQEVRIGLPYSELDVTDDPEFLKAFYQGEVVHKNESIVASGMGSSAALAIALLAAKKRLHGQNITLNELIQEAWDIEVNKIGLYGGLQDHIAAAYGGVNFIEFNKDGFQVTPLARGFIEPLLPSLVLMFSGEIRTDKKIQEGFKDLDSTQVKALDMIKQLAVDAIDPIGNGDYKKVGELLDTAWALKKESNAGVSNPRLDNIYENAKHYGALGGKVCGAGGGGFMIFVVDPAKRAGFIEKMEKEGLKQWDFSPCWQGVDVRKV